MKWIIAVALGYWTAYQVYHRHGVRQLEEQEEQTAQRLRQRLKSAGWKKQEIDKTVKAVFKKET